MVKWDGKKWDGQSLGPFTTHDIVNSASYDCVITPITSICKFESIVPGYCQKGAWGDLADHEACGEMVTESHPTERDGSKVCLGPCTSIGILVVFYHLPSDMVKLMTHIAECVTRAFRQFFFLFSFRVPAKPVFRVHTKPQVCTYIDQPHHIGIYDGHRWF